MKKSISIILVAVMIMSLLAGCGGAKEEPQAPASQAPSANAPASQAPAEKSYEIKLAHVVAETTVAHQATLEFAKLVEEKSNGTLKVTVYPNSALGNEKDLVENINSGAIEMGYISSGAIGGAIYPDLQVVDLPYLFGGLDAAHEAARGEIMQTMFADMESKTNLKTLDAWVKSPRHLYTSGKGVAHPDDLIGMKIRVPDIALYFETFKAFGASTTPIAFSEVYSSMMQGVVEGVESSIDMSYGAKFNEVSDYVSLMQWNISLSPIIINKNFFGKLSENQQNALMEAALEAGEFNLAGTKNVDDEYIAKFAESGCEIIEPDLVAFREKAQAAIPQLVGTLDTPELYDQISEKYGK